MFNRIIGSVLVVSGLLLVTSSTDFNGMPTLLGIILIATATFWCVLNIKE